MYRSSVHRDLSVFESEFEFELELERLEMTYLLPDTMECLRMTSCDSLRSSANTNFHATLRLLPLNVFPTL